MRFFTKCKQLERKKETVRAFIRRDFDQINRGVIIKNNFGCFMKQP